MLAQAASSGDIVAFVQYGVLGLVVLGFIAGWIWPKPSVDRLLRDNARLENQVDELTRIYQSEVIPTMVRSSEVLVKVHQRLEGTS